MDLIKTYKKWLYSHKMLQNIKHYYPNNYDFVKNIMRQYFILNLYGIKSSIGDLKKEFGSLYFEQKILNIKLESIENINVNIINNYLIVGEYIEHLSNRMELLINMVGLENTAMIYLNYSSLYLLDNLFTTNIVSEIMFLNNFTYYGFTNSIIYPYINMSYPYARYCSLFPTIEPNSDGLFKNIQVNNFEGDWFIDLPNIEIISIDIINKIFNIFQNKDGISFCILLRNYKKAVFSKVHYMLYNSVFTKQAISLNNGRYYLTNIKNELIKPNYDSLIFILSNNNKNYDYFCGQLKYAFENNKEYEVLRPSFDIFKPKQYNKGYQFNEINEELNNIDTCYKFNNYQDVDIVTPLVIDEYYLNDKRLLIINDAEKFEGGSKERAINVLIDIANKYGTLVYAGPKYGYAQIVIAKAAYLANKKAVLFIQNYDDDETVMTFKARNYGAEIISRKEKLQVIDEEVREYIKNNPGYILTFGLNETDIFNEIKYKLIQEINVTRFPVPIKRIWMVAGSAVFLNILYQIFPDVEYHVVQVGKKLDGLYNPQNTVIHMAPYSFLTPTKYNPPYKSIPNYDAKVWEFVLKYGQDGDYILNVGKS